VKQAAQVLVHAELERPILHDLFDHLAAQKGFPTVKDMAVNPPADVSKADWTVFGDYYTAIHPHVSMHAGYVPVGNYSRPALSRPRPVTLY